jgi:hypothetical protein
MRAWPYRLSGLRTAISNEREPKRCLGRVFNFKLGSFTPQSMQTLTSEVENSAQVSSCKLKLVNGSVHGNAV